MTNTNCIRPPAPTLTYIPKPAGNAKVIASWPTKEKSTLSGIGRLHLGPLNKGSGYRVW